MIREIFAALEDRKTVILVGPRACGKTVVIDAVLAKAFSMEPVDRFPGASLFNKGRSEPFPYTIIRTDVPVPYSTFNKFMDRRDCSFIMELETVDHLPSGYYSDSRVSVIEWPGTTNDSR